jgi:SAM-dependent methyltransferase
MDISSCLAKLNGLPMPEFTGERVIPGLVEADLLNEHLARYRFAAHFSSGARVFDAGCGTGYGTAEFINAASVFGADISADAITYASRTYGRPGVFFLRASCDSLPFADQSFDLITAFEVIEHLDRWQDMLNEAARLLRPDGILLVSTPNKAWYTEARGTAGPNPWHVREFEFDEFTSALRAVFPHINVWTQNHAEAIAFTPAKPSRGEFDAEGDTAPEHAHFFFAACSRSPIAESRAFAWSPASGNILRERGRHIALLENEISRKDEWLKQAQESRSRLQLELEQSNDWAGKLDIELKSAGDTIVKLQAELESVHAGYREKIGQLETEAGVRLDWIRDVEAQLAKFEQDTLDLRRWAQSLDAALSRSEARREIVERSKWVRLGRKIHLAPAGKPE